jgi:hypothetical protein
MKKVLFIKVIMLSMLVLVTACFEERDNSIDKTWVSFDETAIEIPENNEDPIEASITYSGPLRNEPIQVNYTISSPDGAVLGEDYILPETSGIVTIPAGQSSVTFDVVEILDNDAEDGNRPIVVTIESAAGLTIGFPGPDQLKKSATITIVDNDCAFDIADFIGQYDVEVQNAGTFGYGATSGTYSTSLEAGTEPNSLVDPGFWEFSPAQMIIDPTTLTVTMDGTQYAYTNASGLDRFWGEGDEAGALSTCNLTFTVNAVIYLQDQATVANIMTLTYTRK